MAKTFYLDPIPVDLDESAVIKALHLDKLKQSPLKASEIIGIISPLIHARGAYRVSDIEAKAADWIQVEGRRFKSRVLRDAVQEAERVFPFILTLGEELEKEASSEPHLLKQVFIEISGDLALKKASDYLARRLKNDYSISRISSLNPGSLEDWPIHQQIPLFETMKEGSQQIRVHLTKSLMMIPRKSISGFFFPVKKDFSSCRLCERKHCPGRMAPYNKIAAAKYQKGLNSRDFMKTS